MKAHRVVRRRGSHIFYTIGSQMAVRLSAPRAGRPLPPGSFVLRVYRKRWEGIVYRRLNVGGRMWRHSIPSTTLESLFELLKFRCLYLFLCLFTHVFVVPQQSQIIRKPWLFTCKYEYRHKYKKTPWLWSASELCRPSDRRFLAT
jgi:hypothetical protein